MLKARVKSLDGIPEALQSLYAKQGDDYVLEVEGMVGKDKLDEFRDNNISLQKRMDDLSKQFEGIDPAKARKLDEEARTAREDALKAAGKVDEIVAERVAAMKADHEKQMKALQDDRDSTRKHLEVEVIDNAIRAAAAKGSVRDTAIDDVLLRGRSVFRMVDGKAIPMEGEKPVFGKSGDPMGIEEWVGGLATSAPHLFRESQGAGANKGQGKGVGAGQIARDDTAGFLANVDKIASGQMRVV